jgi:hypothetical protein
MLSIKKKIICFFKNYFFLCNANLISQPIRVNFQPSLCCLPPENHGVVREGIGGVGFLLFCVANTGGDSRWP